jgi:integration host factor subunit beta
LSRPEIIKNIKTKHPKLSNIHIEMIIDTFFQSIEEALINNKSVELRGFGTFFVREIGENHSGRNPKTGEVIYVPKRNKIRFRASKKFKEFINQ